MRPEQSLEQVTGILVREEIPFEFHEDKKEIGIGRRRAIVFLSTAEDRGTCVVNLQADMAVGIDLTPEVKAGVYFWANERNISEPIGRHVVHQNQPNAEGEVATAWATVEWCLDSEGLTSRQLIDTVNRLLDQSERLGGELVSLFGGQTVGQVQDELDDLQGRPPTQ